MYPTNPSTFLVRVGRVAEYSPLVSTVTAIVNTIQKIWLAVSHESRCHHSYYYTHIKEKHWIRVLTVAVPFLGNLAIFLWDFFSHKSNLNMLQLADQKEQIGIAKSSQKNHAAAQIAHEFALYLRTQATSSMTLRTATSHLHIASTLSALNQHQEAERHLHAAYRIRKACLGTNHVLVAKSAHALGWGLCNQSKYEKAYTSFILARDLRTRHLGRDHLDTADSQYGLAWSLYEQGRHEEAKTTFELSRDIYKTHLGEEHPKVASSLHGLGLCLFNAGNYAKAGCTLSRAVWIRGHACEIPPFQNNQQTSVWKDYTSKTAFLVREVTFETATISSKFTFGKEHLLFADSLLMLGWTRWHTNSQKSARTVFEIANFIRQHALGTNHLDYAATQHALGWVILNTGPAESALLHYERSSVIRRGALDANHPFLGESEHGIALAHFKLQDYQKALSHFETCKTIYENNTNPGYWNIEEIQTQIKICKQKIREKEDSLCWGNELFEVGFPENASWTYGDEFGANNFFMPPGDTPFTLNPPPPP